MLSGRGDWLWGRSEGFLVALRAGGVPVLHSLIGLVGPGGPGGGEVGLTPDVTGHVGQS